MGMDCEPQRDSYKGLLYNDTPRTGTGSQMVYHINIFGFYALCWVVITPITYALAGFAKWFNEWVFADWISLNWLVVLLVSDTVTGAVMHLIKKDFSIKELVLKTLINKVFISSVWLVLIHVVAKFSELNPDGDVNGLLSLFRNGVLFTYFLMSITDSLIIITNGKFPPGYEAFKKKFGNSD